MLRSNTNQSKNKGSVLIAVLAIIALLAFLTTKFIDDSVKDLEYQALFEQPTDFRSLAFNTLEITLAVIHEVATIDDGKIHHPEQGWGNPMAYFPLETQSDWDIQIRIKDPTGKIPFNALSEDEMTDLLEDGLDLDFSTAQELKDVWIDWIDSDEIRSLNGAESEDYEDLDPPYRSPNRPIQSLEELRWMQTWNEVFFNEEGEANELFYQLDSLISLIHNEPVNINAAPANVLDYLLLNTSWDADALFDQTDKPYLTKLPESLNSNILTTETNVLHIQITLRRGTVPFTLNALVEKDFQLGPSGSKLPGKAINEDQTELKFGTPEEQIELKFPFKLLRLSENAEIEPVQKKFPQSNLDI